MYLIILYELFNFYARNVVLMKNTENTSDGTGENSLHTMLNISESLECHPEEPGIM